MEFKHSEDRQMLANTLGRYLSDHYDFQTRVQIATSDAGWSRDRWMALAELGIVGALFDDQSGGFGGSGFDIAAVFEQLGRALVVEPYLGTLMAGRVIARAAQHQDLLDQVIAGSKVLAFAHEEPRSHYDLAAVTTHAQEANGGWVVTGTKAVVPQLAAADHILVSARTQGQGVADDAVGMALLLVDKGAKGLDVRRYPLLDGGCGGDLILNATPALLIAEDGYPLIEEAVATGIVALTWEAVGIMDELLASTLEYLRTRKQFGVPIGKFQALQHRIATVALEVEQARSAAINVAAALGGERRQRERSASAAKFTVGRVGTLTAEEAIQMHGGIGMTWELPLSHFAKRLVMIGHQLGDEDHHIARYISLGRETDTRSTEP